MNQAIEAYRQITAEDRFKEIERMRSRARHDEASALRHAAEVAAEAERGKWQVIVADKDSALADKDSVIADKDSVIADKETEIKKLRELLDKQQLSK